MQLGNGKRSRRGGSQKKVDTKRSRSTFTQKLAKLTDHQFVGGITVALALGLTTWVASRISCGPKPLQDLVTEFAETRQILSNNRGQLSALARHTHQADSTLTSAYPVMEFGALIAPDESWLHPNGLVPLSAVKVEWEENPSQVNLDEFQFENPPFTKANGYSSDILGYAQTIAELNAPLGRYDKLGQKGEVPEQFETWHSRLAAIDSSYMFDGDLLRATKFLHTPAGYELRVAPATYFQFTNSCEIFAHELAGAVRQADATRQLRDARTLNDWEKLQSQIGNLRLRHKYWDVFEFRRRAVGIGISVLFIRLDSSNRSQPQHQFYFHDRRVGTASEAMGSLHVVPAGGFIASRGQTPSGGSGDKPRIEDQVIIETLDELFGVKIEEKLRVSPEPLEKLDSTAAEIISKLRDGAWQLFFAGAGVDPLNLKLEICLALVARCTDQDRLLNGVNDPHREGAVLRVPFTREKLAEYSGNPNCLPAAKVCLDWALRNYNAILSRSKVPDGKR